ncbi:MAG: molybdenum cofactor biosynthesis protein [Deltaproteobacteria bacterium]|nr:molybdenum cofactor biosynthesis protein [Deltaproteobacteria bacterium]
MHLDTDFSTSTTRVILKERAEKAGHTVVEKKIVKDDEDELVEQLNAWCDDENIQVILATGGSGVTARDVTPEAVERVAQKKIPGFGELFRQLSYDDIATSTIQSRATAAVKNKTYIFCLPGSTGACRDGWDKMLVHQLDMRTRPCNFAELIARL